MAFSKYDFCFDCGESYTRTNGAQRRCPACQATSVKEKGIERHRIRREQGLDTDGWDRFYYVVVDDPAQPEWHGKIPEMQVFEGCRLATFSEGTVLRKGRRTYKVVGATSPYPFMQAVTAQRLEELERYD